ncbi:MAG: hypothetical protein NTY33_01450 [Candidatus Moranbacteria bacterium]|nr:hypothetical protein [Candidatus Moranbacteria bacterium]
MGNSNQILTYLEANLFHSPLAIFLLVFLAIVVSIFLGILLEKIYLSFRRSYGVAKSSLRQGYGVAKQKIKTVFSPKAQHNFALVSKEQKKYIQAKQHLDAGHLFISPKYPAFAIGAILLFATLAYSLPEQYQLANLAKNAGVRFIATR